MFKGIGFVAVGQLVRYTWIPHQILIDDLNKFIGLIS